MADFNVIDATNPEDTVVSGKTGADSIKSAGNNIIVNAGAGDDIIEHSGSNSALNGQNGNDTITNNSSHVTINGGMGDDSINNSGDYAVIDGGDDDDVIYTGKNNTLTVGDGDDTTVYKNGSEGLLITDYSESGDDVVKIGSGSVSSVTESGEDLIAKVGSGNITLKGAKGKLLHFSFDSYDSIYSAKSDVTINGTSRDDIITSTAANNTIIGLSGKDTIISSGTQNVIYATDDDNSIIATGAGATISVGNGNDIVTLGSNALYKYTSGSDVIYSYNDTDTIQVDNALDVFNASKVTIAADSSATTNALLKIDGTTITIVGGTKKRINVLNSTGTAMTGFIVKSAQDSNTSVVKYNIDNAVVNGSNGNDYVVNSKDGAALALGAGNDTYELVAHNAAIQYESGQDIVLGFDSTDKVSLSYVTPPFIGGKVSGNDIIIYANQDGVDSDTDVLTLKDVKTQTVNVVRGNSQYTDQVLTALNGNITLHGFDYNDVFYYRAGNGNQTIVGYDSNDSIVTSTDTSVTNAAIKNNNVVFAIGNSSLTVKDGASNRLNIVGYGAQEYGEKSIEVENLDGDIVNATLNASVVTIDGATSRTTSVYLIGNKNNNKILGTENVSSTLHGGTGNDTLTGGNTSDTFVYSSGKDVITNYNGYAAWSTVEAEKIGSTDTDVIYLSGVQLGSHSISGTDVVFTLGSGSLTVKDAKNKQITFVNEAGEIDTGTTKIYRSDKEFIVTDDDLASLKSAQTVPAGTAASSVTVTVTAADAKVTLIDANLELDNYTDTSLAYTNLYISGYKDTANTLKASKYGNDTLVGSTKADTLVGSGSVIETITAGNSSSTVEVGGSDTYLYKYGMGKDVIVNYKEADKIFFTSTDTTLTGSTLKSGNITFTVTDLKGKNKSTFVVRDVAGKKITFANEDGNLYSQVFGTTAITVSNEDEATVNTKPNTAVKSIDASTRTDDIYILGNGNANSIKGGTGEVTLQGGAGKDTLTRGDNSHTTFAFGSNEGTANVVTSYIAGSDTIKVLSGALTATATIKNSNDLTFTIGKTKVRVKDAKGKAITVVDANDTSTTQVYGLASIKVADDNADVGATVNTAANSTVVTIDAAERTGAVYLAGNAKANVILAGKSNETIATAKGKDTVAINDFKNDQHVIITDYVSGTDKIRLASGVTIVAAETLKSGSTKLDGATLAADTMLLTLESGTGTAKVTSYLAVEGAIKTSTKGKTTYGKITVIDDTNGFTYSQAYGVDSIAVANADGATVDTNGNSNVKIINAKKRTSKAVIIGNDNVNSIVGGTKADTIYAGTAGATINAAAGNDWIFGTVEDSDTSISVTGGAGKDTIVAGLGKNTLSGGKGNDVFVFEVVAGKGTQGGEDTILDFNTGTNTLRLESGTSLVASTLRGNDTYLTLQGASANDTKAIKLSNLNGKKVTIYDGTTGVTTKQAYGVESIAVANGDAGTIDGSASYNSALKIINGKKLTKSIYLIGNSNNGSKIVGGSKADTIQSGKGSTTMTGGKGDDLFIYGGGNDTITDYSIVNKNNDVLQFAIGNPTYYHVEGKNVILEFSDTAEHAVTTNTLTIVNGKNKKFNFKDGTPSFGTLDPNFDGTFDDYTQLVLTKATTKGEVKAGSSLDYRTTYINASKNNGAITIVGNDSDSTIVASAKADNIKGGSEDDLITTGKGKDTISISGGNDTITDYAVGSDVIHLNGATLESAKTNGNDVVFTLMGKDSVESTLRVQNAMKKGLMQKITIYDDTTRRTTSQAYGTSQSQITVAGGDGDTIDLDTSVNSGVKTVDASKRKASQSIYINGNAQSNSLKGGAGNDTLIGGDGGSDVLIGGKGSDSLVGGTGSTTFDPGKGDDMIVISTNTSRGKATITYTAGGDKIYNYKSTDSISLSTSAKATSATQKSDGTYTINFKSGGSLEVGLATGQQASDTFKITKTTATKVSGSKSKLGGTGSDSGTTVYDWTINYYVSVSNIRDVKISNVSKTISKAANESEALRAASSYEERFYNELFADDVLVSADDLSEIAATNVDKAAIAADLTTTSLTDFKTDTESLTTIIQTDKDKK